MAQYIDKDKAIAEIERLKKEEGWCQVGKDTADVYYARGFRFACERIINVLDTSEVKEVDLQKEINKYISDNFFGSETMGFFANRTKVEPDDQDIALCAQHFFELGLKARKGE